MFIKFIKEISLKNKLKNRLDNVKPCLLESHIKTIGVLVDESYFSEKENLIKQLVTKGFNKNNISLIVFRDKIKKEDKQDSATFSYKDISWIGQISPKFVNDFINTRFDLLISYYDTEKSPLLLITNESKASFKVGFSSTDKRLNHLMVNTNAENYKVFTEELVRYLKILNKI